MLFSIDGAHNMAQKLLQIRSVILNVSDPFTWTSGLKAPIYCDNRLVLSHPELRRDIQSQFMRIAKHANNPITAIAGVATAGIPHATLVADALNLPLVYVRTSAKKHGKENLIEGDLQTPHQVLLVEDLISTAGSSLTALSALQAAGHIVNTLAGIFSYNFPEADQAISDQGAKLYTLTDYNTLIDVAYQQAYIGHRELEVLQAWRKDPEHWNPS